MTINKTNIVPIRYLYWLIIPPLLWLVVSTVSAHQLKTASTSVLFSERSGLIEVSHRFYLHDAEHAVKQLFDKNADIREKPSTQAQFAAYVEQHFGLQTSNQEPVQLTSVGYEVDGVNFWIYQEAPLIKDLDGLRIKHNSLQDIWYSQQNLVNVEGNGPIRSVTFTVADDWQEVRF